MTLYTEMKSPLGTLLLTAENGSLIGVHFPGQKHDRPRQPHWQRADDEPVLAQARTQWPSTLAASARGSSCSGATSSRS